MPEMREVATGGVEPIELRLRKFLSGEKIVFFELMPSEIQRNAMVAVPAPVLAEAIKEIEALRLSCKQSGERKRATPWQECER